MAAKCVVHMHITDELKAYWLTCLFTHSAFIVNRGIA